MGARLCARPGFAWVLILSLFAAFFAASTSSAALTLDLRAVSGSQVSIHSPKSVAVTPSSVGGWIDFELYAFVNGANDNASDESIHSFVGNMLSTHFGHGAVGGSMLNTGEMDSRIRRGIVAPLDHFGYSDGWLQNLDDDPELEIGGTGEPFWNSNTLVPYSTRGAIIGRGDPFRVRNFDGQSAVAEFLLYRFTLPVESFLATELEDFTAIHFEPWIGNAAGNWREDGMSRGPSNGGAVDAGQSVFIHTAESPTDIAAIPEPATYILGILPLFGLICARRRRLLLRRASIVIVLISSFLALTTRPANAALTFDLRAVSGSQVTIHSAKSVAVTQNSVGGWIDFELWGVVTASNNMPADDWMQNFAGSMLSDQFGNGAVAGTMINTGDLAPRIRRGVASPFDNPGYSDGRLQNLDSDPDLEIGGRNPNGSFGGTIAGRTGRAISYDGANSVAEFALYRFTLPIAGLHAQSLADITSVRFLLDSRPASFLWTEDDMGKSGNPFSDSPGEVNVGPSVLIHTAQTPEELAAIPEPGTWALGLSGILGAGWFAKRRRRR